MADLSITSMDDDGMWIWAGILTTVGLVASYVLAVAWQKWRDRKKEDAR